jgi:hypothetical protein
MASSNAKAEEGMKKLSQRDPPEQRSKTLQAMKEVLASVGDQVLDYVEEPDDIEAQKFLRANPVLPDKASSGAASVGLHAHYTGEKKEFDSQQASLRSAKVKVCQLFADDYLSIVLAIARVSLSNATVRTIYRAFLSLLTEKLGRMGVIQALRKMQTPYVPTEKTLPDHCLAFQAASQIAIDGGLRLTELEKVRTLQVSLMEVLAHKVYGREIETIYTTFEALASAEQTADALVSLLIVAALNVAAISDLNAAPRDMLHKIIEPAEPKSGGRRERLPDEDWKKRAVEAKKKHKNVSLDEKCPAHSRYGEPNHCWGECHFYLGQRPPPRKERKED